MCFCLILGLVDAGTCLSQNGSTGRRYLSFDGISTPTGTSEQRRNTPEKDLETTNVETEQNKNESPPIVVEREPSMMDASGSFLCV